MNLLEQNPKAFTQITTGIYSINGLPHLLVEYDQEEGYAVYPDDDPFWYWEFHTMESINELKELILNINTLYAKEILKQNI